MGAETLFTPVSLYSAWYKIGIPEIFVEKKRMSESIHLKKKIYDLYCCFKEGRVAQTEVREGLDEMVNPDTVEF